MTDPVVLLVEDNEDDIELTRRSFEKNNLANTMVVTRNGQEALDYLFGQGAFASRGTSEAPILVLLDLNLPKVSGLEVLHRIRSHPPTQCIPVVVLTTSTQAKDKLESYRFGANSYIRKPVDFDIFTEMTLQLGTYWLKINEPPPTHL